MADAMIWPDAAREQAFSGWLAVQAPAFGLVVPSLRLAASDAGFRRYLRIDSQVNGVGAGRSFIIMDAPPQHEDCRPFVHVQQLLAQARLHVPVVHAWDEAHGFMLLQDLGQQTLLQWLLAQQQQIQGDAQPQSLYQAQAWQAALVQRAQPWFLHAVDTLVALQQAVPAGQVPPYDAAVLQRELALFPQWYVQAHRQYTLSEAQQHSLQQVFDRIVAENLDAPQVLVHRDFMPRNLMMPPDGQGPLGLLDFQDALHGPITYDIASLMRDAFWSWEEDFVLDVTVRYWERARKAGLLAGKPEWESDFGQFYRAVDWMALQRHLKVAGIFARLGLRDHKPRYLADTPRFIGYIRATASRYRELAPLLRLVDEIEQTPVTEAFSFGRL